MRTVQITKNAKLQRDEDGMFWLLIQSSAGPAMFNLSAIETNSITGESAQISLDEKLEAFMREQQTPIVDSPN
jgi:hypothetical protein